jgi:hypothetical protein
MNQDIVAVEPPQEIVEQPAESVPAIGELAKGIRALTLRVGQCGCSNRKWRASRHAWLPSRMLSVGSRGESSMETVTQTKPFKDGVVPRIENRHIRCQNAECRKMHSAPDRTRS